MDFPQETARLTPTDYHFPLEFHLPPPFFHQSIGIAVSLRPPSWKERVLSTPSPKAMRIFLFFFPMISRGDSLLRGTPRVVIIFFSRRLRKASSPLAEAPSSGQGAKPSPKALSGAPRTVFSPQKNGATFFFTPRVLTPRLFHIADKDPLFELLPDNLPPSFGDPLIFREPPLYERTSLS